MSVSDVRHVKATRREWLCSWCWEVIEVGEPLVTWFTFGEAATARMHPECFRAQLRWAADSTDVELPIPATYRRGCYCEDDPCECETVVERQIKETP